MTIQEMMERSGIENTTLTLAWIKDAMNEIQSSEEHQLSVDTQDVVDGTLEYDLPTDLIAINSISMLDTDADQYKSISRLASTPVMEIDNSP